MNTLRLTKSFSFEAAHALTNYDGPCSSIHPHSYLLEVTIIGTPDNDIKPGMVMDFKDLETLVKEHVIDHFDHSLVLHEKDERAKTGLNFEKIVLTSFQPTCENLVIELASRLFHVLPGYVKLHSLKLLENASSYIEWYSSDNDWYRQSLNVV